MTDPSQSTAMGLAGQQAIHREHQAEAMAQQTLELYRRVQAGPLT